ncbi:unnamed protein product [Urochloa humidicola]
MAPKAFALFLAVNLFVLGTMPTDATTCPSNTLQLNLCANALNIVKLQVGSPVEPCCTLVQGLVAADAAACFCTIINGGGILGIPLISVPVDITLLLNGCGYSGSFSCPSY